MPEGQPRTPWEDYTLRVLDGIMWDFNQTKCWRCWRTVMCGGSILSCCASPATLTDMSRFWKKKSI